MEENLMTVKTYGENMSNWDSEADARYFRRQFDRALARKDYPRLEELIEEGRRYNYPMPATDDVNVLEMKADAFMNSFRWAEVHHNYSEIVKLFHEAIKDGYPIPAPRNPIVMSLIIGLMSFSK